MAKMATLVKSNVTLRLDHINTAVLSHGCSKRYMENAVSLYIVNILYNRLELPKDEFEERHFGDSKFVVFKITAKDLVFHKFNAWMDGFKYVMRKDLLRDFLITIRDSKGDVKEYYKFTFSFLKNAEVKQDAKFLHDTMFKMFNTIKLMGQYPKWRIGEHKLTAQISHVHGACELYQVPNFVRDIKLVHSIHRGIENLDAIDKPFGLDKITTGHHTLARRDNSEKFAIPGDESDKRSVLTTSDDNESDHRQALDSKAPSSPRTSIKSSSSDSNVREQLPCICGSDFLHGDIPLETCSVCANKYHRPCFGHLLTPIPNFRCLNCRGTANIPDYLMGTQITVYRIRLILAFCYSTGEAPRRLMWSFPAQFRKVIGDFLEIKVGITWNDKCSLSPKWNKEVEKLMEKLFVDYAELEHSVEPSPKKFKLSGESIKSCSSDSDDQEQPVCICGSDFFHGDIALESCSGCANKYHRPCFGHLLTPIPNFRCLDCSGTANVPLDQKDSEITLYRTRLTLACLYITDEALLRVLRSFPPLNRKLIEAFLELALGISFSEDKYSLPPGWNKKVEKFLKNFFVDCAELERSVEPSP